MKAIKFLLLIAILGLAAFLYFSSPKTPSPKPPTSSSSLKNAINQALEGTSGTYGIVVKNLKTGESYSQNQNRQFGSASLYKLWVMTTAMKQIEQGLLNKDEVLSQDVAYLNAKFGVPEEAAELIDGTVTLNASESVEQMITTSNNYDAFLLTDRISATSVAAFLKENGFTDSDIGTDGVPPTTTASDIALFLEKLCHGQLANKENTDRMLSILENQQFVSKLPKNLPPNTVIAHKTGELDSLSHDAGIVFGPKGDYIIVVLSESDLPYLADDRIAGISQGVYEYFNK